jgi:hypothetical protein
MRFKQRATILVATTTGVVACAAIAVPAAASAASLWVAHATTVSGNGTSCTKPGYNTIQSALEKASSGGKVEVCGGTYTEQLQITNPVTIAANGSVTVKLPANPANATTECDTATGTQSYAADQDEVSICTSGTVTLTGLTIDAAWPGGTCYESLYGVLVAGGATLKASGLAITAAGAVPLDGCQGGVGIQVGMGWTTPVEVGHATLSNVSVSGYQKNGITVDGTGSTATISNTTVTGIGATPEIAQNGIQVSNGAESKISNSVITGDECDVSVCGPNSLTETQSAGILFYGASAGSSVSKSTISDSDVGVYSADASPTAPTSSQLAITSDKLTADRYESVLLDQGWATVNSDEIEGGNVGIQLIQYAGQSYGAKGTGSNDTISGMADWAVQGLSDGKVGEDRAGSFAILKSHISGNPPGASVSNSVTSNSPSLAITTASNDS